jgi:MoxR-like ATPase
VIAGGEGPRLSEHLNNHMFISHFHSPEDGYPNLVEQENDAESISSVVRKSDGLIEPSPNPAFTESDILALHRCGDEVTISTEITSYVMNIIAFLRLHRAVLDGISPLATSHCIKLAKSLAPLHGLRYVTPSLVTLAVKKIYPHRISITPPERERSVQWGSNIDAVTAVLEGMGPDAVIDDVLGSVEVPL